MSSPWIEVGLHQLITGEFVPPGEENPGEYQLPEDDPMSFLSVVSARTYAHEQIDRATAHGAAVCARITFNGDPHDTEDYYSKAWPL